MTITEKENLQLRRIIMEIWWMARRYADGRMTYAVEEYNEAIRTAQGLGMNFEPDPISNSIWAKDGSRSLQTEYRSPDDNPNDL